MPSLTLRHLAAVILALAAAPAWAPTAHAAGAIINIDSCQTLSIANTTYRLIADIDAAAGTDCLVVAANKITIDMQGHTISGARIAITDQSTVYDVITIKNGTVRDSSDTGISLDSARVSVIGVEASYNANTGILLRNTSLIKSSKANFNGGEGIFAAGKRVQIQQTDASSNASNGIDLSGDQCLVTMNTANSNGGFGIGGSARFCTYSFNTTNDNVTNGIFTASGDSGHLITQNTAMRNTVVDFQIGCPSDVTFNTSTNGFPASYQFSGSPACRTAHNDE